VNGSPNPGPSPRPVNPRRGRRWFAWGATLATVVVLAGGAVALVPAVGSALNIPGLAGLFTAKRPDLILHKVRPEYLQVTVVERGTLESAENKDVVCRVKAGARGTYATTIRWVIDDGTMVQKGQLLIELDDSALQEQRRDQWIAVEKAKGEWLKADADLIIAVKQNESDIALKTAAVEVAKLDLDKYLGVRADPELDPLGSLAGAGSTLIERGDFRQQLEDLTSQLKEAQSNQEAYRDRASWAERSVKFGYLTPSQAQVERAKLDSTNDRVTSLQKQIYILQTFTRPRELTDLRSKMEVAALDLEGAYKQAEAKREQAESTRRTAYSVYQQELEKLREIEEQIRECRVHAPQDGMVVYYRETSRRWGSSDDGLIQQGAQVKEGQKLIRIPDLTRMQVNTKVHEAMVSRIRGDDRRSTGFFDSVRVGFMTGIDPFARLTTQSEPALTVIREAYREKEYVLAARGQSARIRVDAFPDRLLRGHVRSVAAVSSMQDWASADVKVYQTLVTIDEPVEGLKPDMSAEVTIEVDPPTEPVLCVPLQAVVGGTESGTTRKVFVMTPSGPQEREVTLGMFNDRHVEVKAGLAEGDEVILNPKVLLGDRAKTREEPAEGGPRRGGPGPGGKMGKNGMPGGGKAGMPGGKGGAEGPAGKGPPGGNRAPQDS
jgi:HlyD family secretion protein